MSIFLIINEFLWGYLASSLIILFGLYLTYTSGLFRLSKYIKMPALFLEFFKKKILR